MSSSFPSPYYDIAHPLAATPKSGSGLDEAMPDGTYSTDAHYYTYGGGVEPVTPPASAHGPSIYAMKNYFSQPPAGSGGGSLLKGKLQFSPGNVAISGKPTSGGGYPYSAPLASPLDTPAATPHTPHQSAAQGYFSTPHTPLAPSAPGSAGAGIGATAAPGGPTPIVPNSMGPGSLGPSLQRQPSSASASSLTHQFPHHHSSSGGAGNGAGGVGAGAGGAGSAGAGGAGSGGAHSQHPHSPFAHHTRSYSQHSLTEMTPNIGRLSLSTANPVATSAPDRRLRPRAYSSSVAGAPVVSPFGTLSQSGALSQGGGGSSLDMSSAYAFPPPLSSPLSPDGLANSLGGGVAATAPSSGPGSNQRPLSALMHGASQDAPGTSPSTSLHRSLSTLSEGGLAIGHGGVASVPTSSRYYRQRRSSSSSSSQEFLLPTIPSASSKAAAPAVSAMPGLGSGGSSNVTASGGSNSSGSSAGAGPANGISVDIATADEAQIYALCMDQRGCRFLQRKLADRDPVVVRKVFNATHEHIVTLMVDPFGNYFCQKLFEQCGPAEITTLLRVAQDSMPAVAVNQHGTRALQKLIDTLSTREQVDIVVSALDGSVVRLIRDLNGNHVIQKLLLNLDEAGTQFIYDAVCESVVEVGSHRHGCCVLQRCLDYAQEQNRRRLVAHIVAEAYLLVCDPFGNYVCQYVIDLGVAEYTNSLVAQLLGHVLQLSVQKFSSNVVEKCLRAADPPLQKAMIQEIMVPRTLHELLLDNYGNYVIQTALESGANLDAATKQQLNSSVQSALATTRSPYGRRIMSKLKT